MIKLILTIVAIIALYLLFGSIVFNLLSSFFDILATATRWLGKIVDWYGVTPLLSNLQMIAPQNL